MLLLFTSQVQALTANEYWSRRTYLGAQNRNLDPLYELVGDVDDVLGTDGVLSITNIIFSQETGDPTATEGTLYYNANSELLRLRKAGSWVNLAVESGTVSLDVAYNNGNTIDVDGTAVTLTVSDGDNNVALAVVQNEATNDDNAMTIVFGAGATGTGLAINSQTGGTDISGDNWSVNQAGGLTAVIATFSGDVTMTGTSADIVFDVSDDEMLVEDDAVVSYGDDADVTFSWNATNLLVEAATDNTGQIIFGSTNAMDIVVNNDAADSTVLFDISGEQVILNGWDIESQDGDFITFGDSLDFTMTATNKVFTWPQQFPRTKRSLSGSSEMFQTNCSPWVFRPMNQRHISHLLPTGTAQQSSLQRRHGSPEPRHIPF